jgi:hypothetical protein
MRQNCSMLIKELLRVGPFDEFVRQYIIFNSEPRSIHEHCDLHLKFKSIITLSAIRKLNEYEIFYLIQFNKHLELDFSPILKAQLECYHHLLGFGHYSLDFYTDYPWRQSGVIEYYFLDNEIGSEKHNKVKRLLKFRLFILVQDRLIKMIKNIWDSSKFRILNKK